MTIDDIEMPQLLYGGLKLANCTSLLARLAGKLEVLLDGLKARDAIDSSS
jgi:hypothetical protein